MHKLEVQNLSFSYSKGTDIEKKAVDNFSFSIDKGEIIGLMGHTGSGKSTLVQLLNGLLKPLSGKVLLDGKDIWEEQKKIGEIRFKVGMVFQYPEYQLFEETVYKDIAFGPKNMGLSEDEIKKRVLDAVQFVGLKSELLQKSPFELSGGEKRRVAIAGVMSMSPEVLILDEPTAGLDPKGKDVLLSQLIDYHRCTKNTIILVSHSMEDIAKNTEKIMVLDNAKLLMFEPVKEIFSDVDRLEKIDLRVPQVTKIIEILRKKGYPLPQGIVTVEEAVKELTKLIGRK